MDHPLFIERSPETAQVFIETLRELGYITDFDAHVLNDAVDITLCDSGHKTSCDKLIFLDLPTPDLIHRILEVRKRPCELTASEEFLDCLFNYSQKTLLGIFGEISGRTRGR